MSLDFTEENGQPTKAEIVQADPISIPPVFCTQLQLEEVNRQLTATIMAMFKMLEQGLGNRDFSYTMLSLYREDILRELDNKLAANLKRVAGPNREDQIRYLQRHPEAILFSGEFARKE